MNTLEVYCHELLMPESEMVCTDPLSYESACRRSDHQVIRSTSLGLSQARTILQENDDIRIIFLGITLSFLV